MQRPSTVHPTTFEATMGLKMYWFLIIWKVFVALAAIFGGGKSCLGRMFVALKFLMFQ